MGHEFAAVKYLCNICLNKSAEVLTVFADRNGVLFGQLLQFINAKIARYAVSPLTICETCAVKFRDHLQTSSDLLNQDFYSQHVFCVMQDNQLAQGACKQNCDCEYCQTEKSGLVMLAEVAQRQRDSSEQSELLDLSMKKRRQSNSDNEDKRINETSEPSTSTKHVTDKTNRKAMSCEHCGKIFTHKGDLNKHLRSHTGEQPFECPMCKRKFAHTSNLARHLRVHSGDRPFRCERCNRDFGRKDKLIMHQKTKLCLKGNAGSTLPTSSQQSDNAS